jgi:hypothetical protein
MKNASVQLSTQQILQLNATLTQGAIPVFQKLAQFPELANRLAGKPGLWTEALETLLPKRMVISGNEVERWNKYYQDQFGVKQSFEGLEIPTQPAFPALFIAMHEQISGKCNPIVEICRKHYKVWQYVDDLDISVTKHDRSGTYGLWVAASPDAEFGGENGKNLSSQDIWDRGLITTTLPERLILGDIFFLENKQHLDQNKITLCPGSRRSVGDVPSVGWYADYGEVFVDCWYPRREHDCLRFRLAIC